MAAKASTHRLEPEVQSALDRLSVKLGRPKNRLINDAVETYLRQQSITHEQAMAATLAVLRARRKVDPRFQEAVEAFVAAEVTPANEDPVEGLLLGDAGPVQTRVRKLLHA